MTEALFYHLERRALDDVLPGLIEKTLERGWRAVIRTESSERADAIDNLLWTYNDQSFLPHAQAGDGNPKRQPVLIPVEEDNPNDANVLFLVGGAAPPQWEDAAAKSLTRIVLLFDGRDADSLARARAAWKD
ncbi:MAG: DNA polymerase III subunit chi, partial [Rhizomicrobium sp.]